MMPKLVWLLNHHYNKNKEVLLKAQDVHKDKFLRDFDCQASTCL